MLFRSEEFLQLSQAAPKQCSPLANTHRTTDARKGKLPLRMFGKFGGFGWERFGRLGEFVRKVRQARAAEETEDTEAAWKTEFVCSADFAEPAENAEGPPERAFRRTKYESDDRVGSYSPERSRTFPVKGFAPSSTSSCAVFSRRRGWRKL